MKVRNYLNLWISSKSIAVLMAVLTLLSFSSCQEEDTADWSPTIAAPLVNSTLSISDLLNQVNSDSLFGADSDGLLMFNFRDSLFDYKSKDLFEFDYDEASFSTFTPNSPSLEQAINSQGGFTASQTLSFNVGANNTNGDMIELDSIYLFDGFIRVNIASNYGHAGQVVITIPEMIKDGVMFSETVAWDSIPGGGLASASENINISGYFMDLTATPAGSNELEVLTKIEFFKSGNYPMPLGEGTSVELGMDDLVFDLAYGDFGNGIIDLGQDTIEFRPFGEEFNADVFLSDPRLRLNLTNEVGVDMNTYVEDLKYVIGDYEEVLDLFNNPLSAQFSIDPAEFLGDTAMSSVTWTNEDGNISGLLNPDVTNLIFDIKGITSPNGSSINQNFISRDLGLKASLDVEIPLAGRLGQLSFNDTLEFDLGMQLESVDSMSIRTIMESYFPANAYLQIYFLDANKMVLDSLYSDYEDLPIIVSPEIGVDGRPLTAEPVTTIKDANLNPAAIDAIVNSTYLVLKYAFETADYENETNVSLYEDYFIKAKLGFEATGNIEF